MAKRKWIGLRSPSFRRLVFTLLLLGLFCLGIWIGKRPANAEAQKLSLVQKQLKQLEQQVQKLTYIQKK